MHWRGLAFSSSALAVVLVAGGCRCGAAPGTGAAPDTSAAPDASAPPTNAPPTIAPSSSTRADVRNTSPVRLLSPLSGTLVTSGSVRFRWQSGEGADVELSRHREGAVERRASGVGEAELQDLQRGTWFWRVRARGLSSAVWRLRIDPRATETVKQGAALDSDINGDGLADLALRQAIVLGGKEARVTVVSAQGVRCDVIGGEGRCANLASLQPIGDVNGDGFDDLVALLQPPLVQPSQRQPQPHLRPSHALFFGRADLGTNAPMSASWCPGGEPCSSGYVAALGDINGDGYGDVAVGQSIHLGAADGPNGEAHVRLRGESLAGGADLDNDGFTDVASITGDGRIDIYRGSATGLAKTPARTFEGTQLNNNGHRPNLRLADWNGDGYADAIAGYVTANGRAVFRVIRGAADVTRFEPSAEFTLPLAPVTQFAWDLDPRVGTDQHPRIALIIACDELSYRDELLTLDATPAGFALHTPPPTLGGPFSQRWVKTVGDVDGDGIDDLAQYGMREDDAEPTGACLVPGTPGPLNVRTSPTIHCWMQNNFTNVTPTHEPSTPTDRTRRDTDYRAFLRSLNQAPAECSSLAP